MMTRKAEEQHESPSWMQMAGERWAFCKGVH
jgi:hypothetical protein